MVNKSGVPRAKYRTTEKLKPLEAVRYHCLDCCCEQPLEVKLCQTPDCPLYPYRFGRNPAPEIKVEIPGVLKSVRLTCLGCATTPKLVEECWVKDCPFYHYRFGKNPERAGVGGKGGPEKSRFKQKKTGLTALENLENDSRISSPTPPYSNSEKGARSLIEIKTKAKDVKAMPLFTLLAEEEEVELDTIGKEESG